MINSDINGSSIISSKPIVDANEDRYILYPENMEVGVEYHFKFKNVYYSVIKNKEGRIRIQII